MDSASCVLKRGRAGIQQLFDAYSFSRQLGRSRWDFAVEIDGLRKDGLTNSDFRWLICNSYVEHGREITSFGEQDRKFRKDSGLRFGRRTCFVLTDLGASFVERYLKRARDNDLVGSVVLEKGQPKMTNGQLTPTWDRDCQELRLGNSIIKQFKVPAPNQEMILAAFQEEGWPVYIDDPLPPHPDMDPKRRLHDTITSLNRSQRNHLIHFRGNGSGQGIRWELVGSRDAADESRRE